METGSVIGDRPAELLEDTCPCYMASMPFVDSIDQTPAAIWLVFIMSKKKISSYITPKKKTGEINKIKFKHVAILSNTKKHPQGEIQELTWGGAVGAEERVGGRDGGLEAGEISVGSFPHEHFTKYPLTSVPCTATMPLHADSFLSILQTFQCNYCSKLLCCFYKTTHLIKA